MMLRGSRRRRISHSATSTQAVKIIEMLKEILNRLDEWLELVEETVYEGERIPLVEREDT